LAGVDVAHDPKSGGAAAELALDLEPGKTGGQAATDHHLALAPFEPTPVHQLDLGPQFPAGRGDAAQEDVGFTTAVAAGLIEQDQNIGRHQRFAGGVTGDLGAIA
jgi:hypothetical protein